MKKLIYLLLFLPVFGMAQISDDSLRSYNNTYVIENTTNAISATMINTMYKDIINSKVNKDSATTVRWDRVSYDTAFYQWYGYSEDTLFFYAQAENHADVDTLYIGNDTVYFDWYGYLGGTSDTSYQKTTGTENIYGVQNYHNYQTTDSSGLILDGSDTIPDCDAVYDYVQSVVDTASWHNWTASLSWTGTAPTVNNAIYRFKNDGNTVHYQIYITFTTSGIGAPSNVTISLPVAPADINNPIIPVIFLSKTGAVYAKNDYAYIDGADNTPDNRLLTFGGGFSLVVETTYGWSMYGFYEISE